MDPNETAQKLLQQGRPPPSRSGAVERRRLFCCFEWVFVGDFFFSFDFGLLMRSWGGWCVGDSVDLVMLRALFRVNWCVGIWGGSGGGFILFIF